MRKYLIYYRIGDKNTKHQSHITIADKIENTNEVLIYCSTRLSAAAFMKIVAVFIQL